MGVIKSSLLDQLKGSLGNVIIYEVNGQIRMRAKSGRYRESNSERRKTQKGRFKEAAAFYQKLGAPMLFSWKMAAKGTTASGYNLFIKENIGHFKGTGEAADIAALKVCTGVLFMPERMEVERKEADRLCLRWKPEAREHEENFNVLQIAVYDPSIQDDDEREEVYWLEGVTAQRSAGVCEFALPEERGEEVHLFAFFKDVFRGGYSESRYIGTFGKEGV